MRCHKTEWSDLCKAGKETKQLIIGLKEQWEKDMEPTQEPWTFWGLRNHSHMRRCLEREVELYRNGYSLAARATENRATAGDTRDKENTLHFLFFHLPVPHQCFLFAGPSWNLQRSVSLLYTVESRKGKKSIWNQWGKWPARNSFPFLLLLMVLYQQRASNWELACRYSFVAFNIIEGFCFCFFFSYSDIIPLHIFITATLSLCNKMP